MGNILSKPKSLKNSLKELKNRIVETEKKHKSLIKKKGRSFWRTFYFTLLLSIFIIPYTLSEDKSLIFSFCILFFLSVLFYSSISFYYSYRIEVYASYLEELRETQEEIIERIKNEEDFLETVELVGSFEDDKIRQLHFNKIKQSQSVLESVTDVVLGGDPSKLYALICRECHYHNGMVPPGEYKKMEYICYNCGTYNEKGRRG